MKVGAILPHDDRPEQPVGWATVHEYARHAEEVGLDSLWVFDHLFHESHGERAGMYEAWTVLSAVAAVTERVELGALVMCSPFRHPVLMAKMAATLDEISGGRLVLGLGAGWHAPEFAALGLSMEQRVGRFDEALQIVTALLRGEVVSFGGSHYAAERAELIPPPTRRIPILVAALRPRMLRLTARYADAWNIAWFGAPDDRFREVLGRFRVACEQEGRNPAVTVGVVVHDPTSGVDPDPDDTVLSGTADDVARALDEYAGLGVEHLVVLPQPHTTPTLDLLAAAQRLRG